MRTSAPVEQILVRGGRATGVVLAGGEEIAAPVVVSNLDVKRTFLQTVAPQHLPPEFLEQVRNFKIRGSSGKLNIALDGLPHFPAIPQGSPCDRAATCTSPIRSRCSSAPTTTGRRGAGRARPTSTC